MGFAARLEIQTEDRVCVLDASDPRELLLTLSKLLQKYDPDLLVSEYGDSFILPQLLQLSNRYGIPLPLNRDPKQAPLVQESLLLRLLWTHRLSLSLANPVRALAHRSAQCLSHG